MNEVDKALVASLIDVSNSGLRSYYMHPEDRSKYISFPVTELGVRPREGVPVTGLGTKSISFDQGMSAQFRESRLFAWSVEGVVEFFSRYGLENYIYEYLIGTFSENNDYAKRIMIPDHHSEWDGEETWEVQVFRWVDRDLVCGEKLAPFQRYTDDPSYQKMLDELEN